jgi:hypothetical protein
MSNLITSLAVAGCRKSDGTPNASGYVFLYAPGTTTIAPGYKDDALTEQWTTVGGGIPLDAAGRANIWVGGKVDVLITDASGATVNSLLGFNGTTASSVEVENAGYTGAIVDPVTEAVSQGAGGLTDLDTVLSRLAASVGGTDGQYQESSGATPQPIQSVLRALQVTPQDFGARGDGKNDDTRAIQSAINEIVRLGGGRLYFPSGTYKISSLLTVPASTGVTLEGASALSTVIAQQLGATDCLAFSASTGNALRRLKFTGGGVSWTSAASPVVDGVFTSGGTNGMAFLGTLGSPSTNVSVSNSTLSGSTTGMLLTHTVGFAAVNSTIGSTGGGGDQAFKFTGSTANVYVDNVTVTGTTGAKWNSDSTGLNFHIHDSPSFSGCVPAFDYSAISSDPLLSQYGNNVDSFLYTAAVGNTLSIKLSNGLFPILRATGSGGGTMTVAAPVIAPFAEAGPAPMLTVQFVNAAGGAVTWSMNAAFVLAGGVAVPSTDGHTIGVIFRWDYLSSKWREVSRSDTTT